MEDDRDFSIPGAGSTCGGVDGAQISVCHHLPSPLPPTPKSPRALLSQGCSLTGQPAPCPCPLLCSFSPGISRCSLSCLGSFLFPQGLQFLNSSTLLFQKQTKPHPFSQIPPTSLLSFGLPQRAAWHTEDVLTGVVQTTSLSALAAVPDS